MLPAGLAWLWVQLRDAAQEAELRRMLAAGLRALLVSMRLGYALWFAPDVQLVPIAQREIRAAGLMILCLIILGYSALRWRRNQLIRDRPGVVQRLTQLDHETCLAGCCLPTGLRCALPSCC